MAGLLTRPFYLPTTLHKVCMYLDGNLRHLPTYLRRYVLNQVPGKVDFAALRAV